MNALRVVDLSILIPEDYYNDDGEVTNLGFDHIAKVAAKKGWTIVYLSAEPEKV